MVIFTIMAKNKCACNAQYMTEDSYVDIKAHQIDLYPVHDKPVEQRAQRYAYDGCDSSQDKIFPEYIGTKSLFGRNPGL